MSALRIFCATWNVAAFPSSDAEQNNALRKMLSGQEEGHPDVYAISLQEIVALNAVNILISAGETLAALNSWTDVFLKLLNQQEQNGSYVLVDSIAVVGTGLIVFARESLLVNGMINENTVLSSSLNLGKFYTGNKAAVSIRARIGDQTVCFISAHLAAHRGSGPAITRTEHITYTLQHLAFYGCVEYGNINGRNGQQYNCCSDANNDNHQQALLSSNKVQGGGKEIASLEVVDHDLCILLGDLNSRMREDVDQSTVWDVIQSYGSGYASGHQTNHGEIANKMLSWDEFKSEPMASTLSNLRFQEGPITFSPTYKLTPKTSKYHVPPVQNPKKVFNHCPAWCDRILYAVRRSSNQKSITVNQNKYYSAPVYISDHLPVWSIFTLNTNDSEGGGISGGSSTNTGNIDTERIEEARLKSLNFSKVDSRDYGCGAGDCNIM